MSIEHCAKENILEAIGNTPIVCLNALAPNLSVNLYGKCEFLNPGGSIKDRVALHMINMAEKRGELKAHGTIIEATSGNTGMGLAIVAALRGYKCIFVMADKQSMEKRLALQALGAHVIVCPTDVEAEDPRSYYQVAARLARDTPNSFYANQYYNLDNPSAHYHSTGPEIYNQCGTSLDYLVLGIGTGGTVSGITRYLREQKAQTKIIGVDPIGSIYYDLFYHKRMSPAHSYLIEGIGEDFMPGTMDLGLIDSIIQVGDEESFIMARNLVRKMGILAGASSGAAILGAIKYFSKYPENNTKQNNKKNALVILVDSSTRYLTKYLDDNYMREKNFSL